jgi:uncharacterized membrane protein
MQLTRAVPRAVVAETVETLNAESKRDASAPTAAEQVTGRLRLELFSDAVFAVAITLLVLNLPLTGESGPLLGALADRWPTFAAFGISFAIIGCLWVSHFRLLRMVDRTDGVVLFTNLALLLTIVLVPFGSSTMAAFVTKPGSQSHLAAALFAALLVLMSLIFGALHVLVTTRAGMHARGPRTLPERLDALRPFAGGAVNMVGIAVAFISPIAVLCMTGGVAIFYFVDSLRNDRVC